MTFSDNAKSDRAIQPTRMSTLLHVRLRHDPIAPRGASGGRGGWRPASTEWPLPIFRTADVLVRSCRQPFAVPQPPAAARQSVRAAGQEARAPSPSGPRTSSSAATVSHSLSLNRRPPRANPFALRARRPALRTFRTADVLVRSNRQPFAVPQPPAAARRAASCRPSTRRPRSGRPTFRLSACKVGRALRCAPGCEHDAFRQREKRQGSYPNRRVRRQRS